MTTGRAFAFGLLCGKLLKDGAEAIALADTNLGKSVRKKLLAKQSYDRLLRTEEEVGNEIVRRVRAETATIDRMREKAAS